MITCTALLRTVCYHIFKGVLTGSGNVACDGSEFLWASSGLWPEIRTLPYPKGPQGKHEIQLLWNAPNSVPMVSHCVLWIVSATGGEAQFIFL